MISSTTLDGRLDHAIRVADPFHVVRLANRCLDQVRRRVQNATLGHRGRKGEPLYRIRKLMVTGAERLEGPGLERMLLGIRAGDPDDEVLGAWLAKESARDVYLTERLDEAGLLLDKAIEGCATDAVAEVRSLGRTLARWRTEILNHHARRLQRPHRGAQPPGEEGQARRPRVPLVRQLPATDPAPCRRRQLARPAPSGAPIRTRSPH